MVSLGPNAAAVGTCFALQTLLVVLLSPFFGSSPDAPVTPAPAPAPLTAQCPACQPVVCTGCSGWALGAAGLLGFLVGVGFATFTFTLVGAWVALGAAWLARKAGRSHSADNEDWEIEVLKDGDSGGASEGRTGADDERSRLAAAAW